MIAQLGKFGDIVNVLPLAFSLSKKFGTVNWLVGRQWADILKGVSYVNPVIWEGTDDSLHRAIETHRGRHLWVTQAWMNPDPIRQTDSFAKEQWRYVGFLNEYGKWPLIFDKRSREREAQLVSKHIPKSKRPKILVATRSVSGPYRYGPLLLSTLQALDAEIIDMNDVKAERVYDMIGLYDAADLLVTIDTVHLHLARASQCPVIFLQNDGWRGAPPIPHCITSWRYAELGSDLSAVLETATNHLARKAESMAIVIETFNPTTDRHKRAMATHPRDAIYSKHDYPPSMKEMLEEGLRFNKDIVVFTHDDVTFLPDTLDKIRRHAQKFEFGCSRRPRNPVHCGREIFWFRSDWLKIHWNALPNPYWSVQKPDLIMCRFLRNLKGIPTTLENLNYDFYPVDVPDIIFHEDHLSHWNNPAVEQSKEGLYNEYLWSRPP